jgi:uncharacterized membrane protein YphA (DoxX/SURF4 family)
MTSGWKKGLIATLFVVVRILLGAAFVYASWDKILHPDLFAQAVANYQLLPSILVNPVAWVLPWLELVCGVCLLIGWITRGSALIIGILMLVFIAALGISLVRGLDIQCGCFALTAQTSMPLYLDILRDILLLAMAITVLVRRRRTNVITMNADGY